MKKSRFTESRVVGILKEADSGVPVNEVWRKHGISSATYYKWKAAAIEKLLAGENSTSQLST